MPISSVYVAHTDRRWFDYLSTLASTSRSGVSPLRLDEVNFWSPKATIPPKAFTPGEPVFFRLRKPTRQIKERWNSGRQYCEYQDRELDVPKDPAQRPSPLALAGHRDMPRISIRADMCVESTFTIP